MKGLSPTVHGVLDYTLIIILLMAPTALGLQGPYAVACYALAAAYLLVVVTTVSPTGLVELIPYRLAGRLALVSGGAFMAAPFVFRFAAANPTARLFFTGFGSGLLLLWLLTDWSGRAKTSLSNEETTHNLRGEPLPAVEAVKGTARY